VRKVVNALESTMKTRTLERLLGLWGYWSELVDPSSPNWIGIDLPGSMVLDGYMILEDFLDLKQFVERATAATA